MGFLLGLILLTALTMRIIMYTILLTLINKVNQMAKLLKQVRLEEKMIAEIQEIADTDFDGNFTAALLDCALAGVNMRSIPEHVRWLMKAGACSDECGQDFYHKNPRVLIDALQL